MGVSYKKDGNRVDMGIKIGTVLSSEVWNIQVKSIKKGFWKDLDRLRKLYEVSLCILLSVLEQLRNNFVHIKRRLSIYRFVASNNSLYVYI